MEDLYLDYAVSTNQFETKPSKADAGKILASVNFQQKKGTIRDLEQDIRSGRISVCGLYDRGQQFMWKGSMTDAWQYTKVVVVDIDNGSCNFDDLLRRMTFTPTLVTTSGSYSEGVDYEHSSYKYHCYYVFKDRIDTIQAYQNLYDHLDYQLNEDGVYDYNSKKDNCGRSVAHLYYGNVNAKSAVNADKVYSLDMFDDIDVTVEYTTQHKNKVEAVKKWNGFLDKELEAELLSNRLVDFVKHHLQWLPIKMAEDESRANEWGIILREYQDLTHLYFNYAKQKHLQFHEIGSGRYKKLTFIAHVYRSWDCFTPEQVAVLLAHWCVKMFDLKMSAEEPRDKFEGSHIYDLVKYVFTKDPIRLRDRYKKKCLGVAISKTYCTVHNMTPQAVYGQWVRYQTDERIGNVYDCNSTDKENADAADVSSRRIATFRKTHNLPRVTKGERTRGAIFQLVMEGWSKKAIAEKLGLSPNTVKQYIWDINAHKYDMNKIYDDMINNIYMYSPQMMGRPTPIQEGKATEAPLSQEEQLKANYDFSRSIRDNVTLLATKGIVISKSSLGRWLKEYKQSKDEVE